MKFKLCLCIVGVLLVNISGCSKKPDSNPAAETAAVSAAQVWLGLIDGGEYGESWEEAMVAARKPLGAMV